jgi:cytoskeletal protein CcmA (bactofilin family)
MTIFRSRGFDSLVGKGTIFLGDLLIAANSTLQVDGNVQGESISQGSLTDGKVATRTKLMVNGHVESLARPLHITVHNVIISGTVVCKEIRVEGTLAIKSGARLLAENIYYRTLVIETGAVVHGQMHHLDHVSAGEEV